MGGCGPWKLRGVSWNDRGRGRFPALSEICLCLELEEAGDGVFSGQHQHVARLGL